MVDVEAPAAARPGSAPWSKGRVLLAEDNRVNQIVAIRQLERRGFQVDVAANGREALVMHESGDYEVIFMDCQMPELDGYQATAEIRRREGAGRRTPIIALTSNTMAGDRDRCIGAGMDDYLSKPVRVDLLDAALGRAIGAGGRPVDAPPLPVLDGSVLDDLCDADDDLRGRLVTMFVDQSRRAVNELGVALVAGEASTVHRIAHTLKGSSGVLGARRFEALAGRLADKAAAGQTGDGLLQRAELERVFEVTAAALTAAAAAAAAPTATANATVAGRGGHRNESGLHARW